MRISSFILDCLSLLFVLYSGYLIYTMYNQSAEALSNRPAHEVIVKGEIRYGS